MPVRSGSPLPSPRPPAPEQAPQPDPAPTPAKTEAIDTKTGEVIDTTPDPVPTPVAQPVPQPARTAPRSTAEDLAGVGAPAPRAGSSEVSVDVWNPPVVGIAEGASAAIEKMLPASIDMPMWMEVAKTAMRRNHKEIAKCTSESVINALIDCAKDGLMPDGNEAFLVARKDKKTGTFRLSYQPTLPGYTKRLKVLKQVKEVNCQPVYMNDHFEADFNSGEVEHKFKGWKRGAYMGVYCQFVFPDGTKDVEIMSLEEILEVERQAGVSSAWKNYKPEMSRKTVFYRLRKRHPLQDPRLDASFRREEDLYGFNEKKAELPAGEAPKALPAPEPSNPEDDQLAEVEAQMGAGS